VKLTWSASSQAEWALATGGPGDLLGSPFNVKWRFSAPAGGVEESKLCLSSVIMPAKCVSSVSPRFHYRRVAFCFLPLAAILEFFLLVFKRDTYCKSKFAETLILFQMSLYSFVEETPVYMKRKTSVFRTRSN
jgi:hypothetical protein